MRNVQLLLRQHVGAPCRAVVSAGDRVFTKTPGKGLYIAFKYNIAEMEVTEEDGTL